MGIHFVSDMWRPVQIHFTCLYCEETFEGRQGLNDHYLLMHEAAFSEEELEMAQAQKARLEQRLKR